MLVLFTYLPLLFSLLLFLIFLNFHSLCSFALLTVEKKKAVKYVFELFRLALKRQPLRIKGNPTRRSKWHMTSEALRREAGIY